MNHESERPAKDVRRQRSRVLATAASPAESSSVAASLALGSIAVLVGALARSLADQIRAEHEDEIRSEVKSLIAARMKSAATAKLRHRTAEPEVVSWSKAFVHGLGDLINFFPESDEIDDMAAIDP